MCNEVTNYYPLRVKMNSSSRFLKSTLSVGLMVISIALSGCGSAIIPYQSSEKMTLDEAKNTTEEIIMTQHPKWRPDSFIIRDDYMLWGYGKTANQQGFAAMLGNTNTAFGSSKTTIRDIGSRIYYKKIKEVQLMSWHRKFKKWFVVSLIKSDGASHVLYTRNEEDAKRLVDSMRVLKDELSNTKITSSITNSALGKNSSDIDVVADGRLAVHKKPSNGKFSYEAEKASKNQNCASVVNAEVIEVAKEIYSAECYGGKKIFIVCTNTDCVTP